MSGISEDVGKLRSIIASMKNGIELGDPIETLEWCADEIRRQRELIAGLTPLARLGVEAIVECSWQGCNFDGGDIQESAVKAGAIQESAEGYDPDVHVESDICDCDPGDRWFEFPPTVLAAKRWLEEGK